MEDLKFELLQRLSKSTSVSPVHRDDLYREAGKNINNVAMVLNDLLDSRKIQKPHGSDAYYLTSDGRAALETEQERREMVALQRESIDLQKKSLKIQESSFRLEKMQFPISIGTLIAAAITAAAAAITLFFTLRGIIG